MSNFCLKASLGQPNELVLYNNDVVIKRSVFHATGDCRGEREANKKKITKLSSGSLRRLAFFASNTSQVFNTMITLTYPDVFPTNGLEVKRHLNILLTLLRRSYPSIKYLWFLEFQKRTAPHIHILVSVKYIPYEQLRKTWYTIVGSKDEKHLKAGTKIEKVRKSKGARHYAVKYAMKCEQKDVPENYQNVGRFWGHSRGISPEIVRTIEVLGYADTIWCLREWKYVHVINHDRIVSILYNATRHVKY